MLGVVYVGRVVVELLAVGVRRGTPALATLARAEGALELEAVQQVGPADEYRREGDKTDDF